MSRSTDGADMQTLWLVRHAQPLIESGVCYGATDIPADAAATRTSALELAQQLPRGTRIICSPLQRCMQLSDALLRLRPDLGANTDVRLVEMDFGCWEGVRWSDIPKSAIDAWTAQFGHWRFGGTESVQELMDRVAAAWAQTRDATGPVAWITHAGVIRAALLLHRNVETVQRSDQWPRQALEFGAHHRLFYSQSG